MLAFLFCLCLAVGGVVGDLTDSDFAKIGSLLDKRDERLYTELGTLKSSINTLETKFDNLETKFDTLETLVKQSFSATHFFNRNRIEVLQNVSENFVHCNNSNGSPKFNATRHTLVYKGKVATVFTPHSDCLNTPAFSPTNNGAYLLHPTLDLAIDLRCSNSYSALDVSSTFIPYLGDEIIAYGFGQVAQVWQGLVADYSTKNCSSVAAHWTGKSRVCNGEIIAQGHQHAGMSGAPVLNGCGYVGMAHVVFNDPASYASVISAPATIDFIEQNLSKLPTLADCGQRILAPPLAAFANCAAKTPLTPFEIIINAIP